MRVSTLLVVALVATASAACADRGPSPTAPGDEALPPSALIQLQGDQQHVPLGTMAPTEYIVRVSTASGRGVEGVPVSFSVSGGGGWITQRQQVLTDERGEARTWWYMGPRAEGNHTLFATSPVGSTGFRSYPERLGPGSRHSGADGLVELHVGTLPLVLSVSRGGELEPPGFVDRPGGVQDPHRFTRELASEILAIFAERGAGLPSLVISNVSPRKVDPDVALPDGASPHTRNDRAWLEFHGFLAAIRADVDERFGGGLIIDLQGADPAEGVTQLGYLLTSQDLDRGDAELNDASLIRRSSVRSLVNVSPRSLSHLVRGEESLGALLDGRGYAAAPSPAHPHPNGMGYRPGGLTTALHGSSGGSTVNAIFLDTPFLGVRESAESRRAFAEVLVEALDEFFELHYGRTLRADLWEGR